MPCENTKRKLFTRDAINTIVEDNTKSSIIIGDINAFPMFLKNLSEIVALKEKKTKPERRNEFDYLELMGLFTGGVPAGNNVIFIKNGGTNSLIEERNGFMIVIKNNERILVIQGFAKDDMLDLYKTNNFISNRLADIKKYIAYEILTVPKFFKTNYINVLNIKDIILSTPDDIGNIIKKRYGEYKTLKAKHLTQLINDFLLASKIRKLELLTIFLCGNTNDSKLGYLLYDILRMKDKKDILSEIYNALPILFKAKLDETETILVDEEEKMMKNHLGELSYERRINLLKITNDVKDKAIDKLKSMKNNIQGDNKAQSWLDGFLKIPFGVYRNNKIMTFKKNLNEKFGFENTTSFEILKQYVNTTYSKTDELRIDFDQYINDRSKYLKNIHDTLNTAVYGHTEAKLQIEKLFAQWINGETKGAVLGLCGPPGTGKTSLAKNGLSKCLIDDEGKIRPFGFLPIGGSVNGSTLVGHNFTYVGSTWGRIVDVLITSECMNPIIFIDEVDKISNTEYGKEIVSVLTHLTDATQNDNFEDKYFSGIPLDLSKALIVFSFNDVSLLDSVLRDRITIIETKPYTLTDKIHIIQEYMLPEILKDVGFNSSEILFGVNIITYLINTYTNEAGVRKIKEKLVDIVRNINLEIIHTPTIMLPFIVTQSYIDELFKNKPKLHINMIHKQPQIGLVNGLYASSTGIGGITLIQVMKYPSEKMLELTITGQQGKVMKESVAYALRIAYSMLSDDMKEKIMDDARNKKQFGLLVHASDASQKKEGPSAGTALTLSIYSVLSGQKINNTIAMTGEIDLCMNIRKIGGLYAKLTGAKASGVSKVLIPKENEFDLNILRNDNISPEDANFTIELIDTFDDVLKYSLVQ
jgi:ATP-dependent Lon protease